jgi:hypothetical protein
VIPESAGATPFGIYVLAEGFSEAADSVVASNARPYTSGPVRLLNYHACELFLKAFLRKHGMEVDELREFNHDLFRMLDTAIEKGLKVAPQTVAQIKKAAEKNDYVRVRYMVTEDRSDITPASLARIIADIRNAVRGSRRVRSPSGRFSRVHHAKQRCAGWDRNQRRSRMRHAGRAWSPAQATWCSCPFHL